MGKFFDWMFGEEQPQPTTKTETPKKPEKRGYFAESKADIEASKAADEKWREREQAAFKVYKPTGPAFKIVQMPAGHFVIQRRYTKRMESPNERSYLSLYPYYAWADKIEAHPVEPYDAYETVKNTDAPIMTKDYNPYTSRYWSERLTGYADLAFNVFEDAEAYLFRMAQPKDHEVGYDFPPLKKRARPSAKKAKAQ